jgi:WD40 repeat protein
VDPFEQIDTLLRQDDASAANRLRAADPHAWLPRWTAGDPLSPALRQVHQLHESVLAVRFDDTGAQALTHEQLLVWDVTTGEQLLATDPDDVPRRADDLVSLAVAGTTAVIGTCNGYLLSWDLTDGRLLARTTAHDGCTTPVAISPGPPHLVLSVATTVGIVALDGPGWPPPAPGWPS